MRTATLGVRTHRRTTCYSQRQLAEHSVGKRRIWLEQTIRCACSVAAGYSSHTFSAHPPLRAGDVEGRTSDSVLGPGPIHVIHRTATVVRASTPEGAIPRSAWLVPSLHNRGHRASRERLGRTLAFCTASASCLPREARAGRWPSALSSQAPPEGGTGLTAPPERGPAQTGACVGAQPRLPRETGSVS